MKWEDIDTVGNRTHGNYALTQRTQIPGGWLVRVNTFRQLDDLLTPIITGSSMTFVPTDPIQGWKP